MVWKLNLDDLLNVTIFITHVCNCVMGASDLMQFSLSLWVHRV